MLRRIIIAAALICASAAPWAQTLSPAQLTTLKNVVLAEPAVSACLQAGDYGCIADWYNATGTKVVWRSSVPLDEIMQNDFDWTRVDNLSVGKARIWEWLFSNARKSIDPSKPNVRTAIDSTWVGTAADLAVRASVYVRCKRAATRFEALYATGTGDTANPATMAVEGVLIWSTILQALNS